MARLGGNTKRGRASEWQYLEEIRGKHLRDAFVVDTNLVRGSQLGRHEACTHKLLEEIHFLAPRWQQAYVNLHIICRLLAANYLLLHHSAAFLGITRSSFTAHLFRRIDVHSFAKHSELCSKTKNT